MSLLILKRKEKTASLCGFLYGGADGTRTHYLIHAMDALSRVSYNPVLC